ncbi:hypothetical protein B2J93_3496 [Marssonina coronariae]|uniref:polynucleotide adenylyltransferase n=1 Tax=Diplocarpon coronariae TaxID=2795749 RepID=A0A218Z6V3_9HELO|nr:hypothetical protein B2J93_3496 [Marssonina coronariae]
MTRPKKAAQRNNMSRQPPLPQGLPPKPAGSMQTRHTSFNDSFNGESYRPRVGDNHYSNPPRAHNQDVYQFGARRGVGASSSYRPQYDRSRSPPRKDRYASDTSRNDFSYRPSYNQSDRNYRDNQSHTSSQRNSFDFRFGAPPGVDFNAAEHHRAPPRQRDFTQDKDNRRPLRNARGVPRGGYRGRAGPRLAAERDFLKTNREPTPELMTGMDEDTENGAKYIAVDDVSDSEEAEMDMSDDETDEAQQPKTKQARTEGKAADGDSVPRWSNPDPYTALPPPDESRGKKKDVVKLIRKARVTSSSEHVTKSATTDDFISFDFGDEKEPRDDYEPQFEPRGSGVRGAPLGPRGFSGSANQVSISKPAANIEQNGHSYLEQRVAPTIPFSDANLPRGPAAQNQSSLPARPIMSTSKDTSFQIKAKANPVNRNNVIDLTSDPALGTRKRNLEDELKVPRDIKAPPTIHDKNQGKPGRPSNGSILSGWVRNPQSPASPWIGIDHSDSASMGVWLHKEIIDFYEYVKPRDFEQVIRLRLVQDLREKFKAEFHREDDVHPFGSFPAGLYLPTSDMDLVCISSDFRDRGRKYFGQKNKDLYGFKKFLIQEGLPLDKQVEVISGAKVPLVKYTDKLTGLKVDISFENTTGIVANTTFQNWKKEFPAMPILVTFIKHFLAMRGLNEPVNGGIGGFSVTCLVVSLLQNMPQVQSRTMIPEHHLGDILMEFLDLYGNQFNTTTTAISLNPPGYIPKASTLPIFQRANIPYRGVKSKLMIIDPNREDNDISGGASNTPTILKSFSDAYDLLQHRMGELQRSGNRKNQSILECIIGGNYRSFELQRAHLAHVHEKIYAQ